MNRMNLLLISFAAIFGSGWLFAPLYAAQIAGPSSLVAWGLGALISMVIGLTMAEVITLFPKSGGLNSVAAMTHGRLLALFVTLFNLLVFIVLPAIEVRAILQYSATKYTSLITQSGEFSVYGYFFATFLLALITLVNLYGTKLTLILNNILVIFKVITPILVCVVFPYTVWQMGGFHSGRVNVIFNEMWPVRWDQVLRAISVSGIIFSFNGFNQATLYAGEAKNPQRAIPFAILGSLVFSAALYLVIQLVFLVSLPPETYAQGWSQLAFEGDQGPFAALAVLLGLHGLLVVIYADAVISPLGTAFNYASSAPRLLFTLVETETHPRIAQFMHLNRHGAPYLAMVFTFLLELAAFFFLPSLKAMISILVAAFVLCYTTAPASLLSLRKTHSNLKRTFKVPCALVFCFFSLFFANLMAFSCGWVALRNLGYAATALFAWILVDEFRTEKSSRKLFLADLRGVSWFLVQILGLALLSYLETFVKVSFAYSSGGIAVLSAVALGMSQRGR